MKFFINSYFGDNQSIGLLSHIKKRLPYGMDDQWMVFSHYTERGWTVDNLWHIFTDFYGGQYAPLAFLSYLVLYAGFGYDPFYFHMFSLLLHISYFKAALVFLFFYCFFLSVYTFHYTKKWENTTMVKKYTKEVLEKRLNGSNHL